MLVADLLQRFLSQVGGSAWWVIVMLSARTSDKSRRTAGGVIVLLVAAAAVELMRKWFAQRSRLALLERRLILLDKSLYRAEQMLQAEETYIRDAEILGKWRLKQLCAGPSQDGANLISEEIDMESEELANGMLGMRPLDSLLMLLFDELTAVMRDKGILANMVVDLSNSLRQRDAKPIVDDPLMKQNR